MHLDCIGYTWAFSVQLCVCVFIHTHTSDPSDVSHLVKSKESSVSDDGEGTDPIFTISRGLVKVTWEPPAWRKRKTKNWIDCTSRKEKWIDTYVKHENWLLNWLRVWLPHRRQGVHFNTTTCSNNKNNEIIQLRIKMSLLSCLGPNATSDATQQ